MPRIAFSSETYFIDPKDIALLEEKSHPGFAPQDCLDEVVLLIGNNQKIGETDSKDVLIKGKEAVLNACAENKPYVAVRIAFEPRNKPFDFVSPLIRVLRYKIRSYGSNVYHMSLQHLRDLNIERTVRTRENAFSYEKKRYKMTVKAREDEYAYLYNSLKENGFMDKYPIDVLVCRTLGVQDTINQGHHRIGVALELGIEKVPVLFSAAGSAPALLRPFFIKLARINMALKRFLKKLAGPEKEPLFPDGMSR